MPPPRPRRLLVADDEPTLRFLYRLWLEADGYEVRDAADGREALAIAEAGELPDGAVLDLDMPVLDGLAVCRRLRALSPELPILVVSGLDGAEPRARAAGATGFLAKPPLADDFRRAVRRLVGAPTRCAA